MQSAWKQVDDSTKRLRTIECRYWAGFAVVLGSSGVTIYPFEAHKRPRCPAALSVRGQSISLVMVAMDCTNGAAACSAHQLIFQGSGISSIRLMHCYWFSILWNIWNLISCFIHKFKYRNLDWNIVQHLWTMLKVFTDSLVFRFNANYLIDNFWANFSSLYTFPKQLKIVSKGDILFDGFSNIWNGFF